MDDEKIIQYIKLLARTIQSLAQNQVLILKLLTDVSSALSASERQDLLSKIESVGESLKFVLQSLDNQLLS